MFATDVVPQNHGKITYQCEKQWFWGSYILENLHIQMVQCEARVR